MKKSCIIVIMLLGVVSMQAQKVVKGSFSALANESAVSVKIDYTDSRIDKVPFEIFLEGEENWDEGYREILFKFVKAANQNSSGLKYLTKQTENYQLVFKAVTVDDDGNTTGSLCLMDKDNQVVAEAGKFKANGGRFGSQMNLMGDAAERLGKKVAKFIEKAIK